MKVGIVGGIGPESTIDTCDAAKARGFRRLGLIGTRFTMRGGFYQDSLRKKG